MRLLVDIAHPAHVHFFKNMIWNLRKKGHQVAITASDKDIALDLLKAYGLPYEKVGRKGNLLMHMIELPLRGYYLYRLAKKFQPDCLCGIGNPNFTAVGRIMNKYTVVFDDTEHNPLVNPLTFRLASVICTPTSFGVNLGKKQVRYNGYHELAYLHPNYFQPDPSILQELGLKAEDRFFLLRQVSWGTAREIGQHGFTNPQELIAQLETKGKVFITSEVGLDRRLEKFQLKLSPEKIHHALFYATLYIGEGATMATEAAVVGTPSIYVSTLAGTMGNLVELEQQYGLVRSFKKQEQALKAALELLERPDLKQEWQKKRQRLLAEKIDVTQFMTDLVENYSAHQGKKASHGA